MSDDAMNLIQKNIVLNMTDGVMYVNFKGEIIFFNPAAEIILGHKAEDVVGKSFGECFFDNEENDEFTQSVLDVIYEKKQSYKKILPYTTGEVKKHLRVVSSFLQNKGKTFGIVIVFSDLSELMDLRDAVLSMRKIQALNEQLEMRNKLLNETFGRFLSDDIVKQLLDTPDGLSLGGQKRDISILMSDLRGFTAMSERMDPADLILMLNHYLEEMTDAIQSKGGTIIEFLGDGIFAIFGAPVQSEDHASNAVAAAIDMQSRMDAINKWNVDNGYFRLEMGIGIHTGEVVVGNIGSEKRTKYGVVGSNVNFCGRIESYTINGQILISEATRKAVNHDITIAKEIVAQPKGVEGKVTFTQVTGIGEPYNISVDEKSTLPKMLDEIIPITFHIVDGKHGQAANLYGGIVALGVDMAILDTQATLNVYDNIQIDAGGKLYCKVIEKREEGMLLHFTSVPSGYGKWLANLGLNMKP